MEASERATWSARPITAFIDGSAEIIGFSSSATADSTAAIRSASGGSGMNSLAPALMAAAASRASASTPKATTGTVMRSFSLAEISEAMSRR